MIIGICGLIGSGKNTAAEIVAKEYDYIQTSMAAPLKDMTAVAFGWPRYLLEGDTKESREFREKQDDFWSDRLGRPWSPRIALQFLGTELFRQKLNDDFWVHALEQRMNPNKNYVIADVRFPNEIEMILRSGGKIWLVERGPRPEWWEAAEKTNTDHNDPKDHMRTHYPQIHYSEWAWIGTKFHLTIDNNGDLVSLYKQIKHAMESK